MEPKVYVSKKKYTLVDGTVKEYDTKRVYIPKDRSIKQVRKKKEGSIHSVTNELRDLNKEELERVRETIKNIKTNRDQANNEEKV